VPQNSVRDNTGCCIRIFCMVKHPYCYNTSLMHIHPNAMYGYMAKKAIAMISVVATIINCNVSLCGNNHNYSNNIKTCCKVLLLATIFNQSHIVSNERYWNKYGPIATIFHSGNRPIF
jgi:hypothetical protein